MGMSNFTDKDVDNIKKWGNAKAKDYWLAGYNKTLYPIPDRRDVTKMKEFMKLKYKEKRFLEENAEDDSDDEDESDDSEEDKKKKKKTKKKKKVKKTKTKKKRKVTSSEEESDESASEEEVKEPPKNNQNKKLRQPNSSKPVGMPSAKMGQSKNKLQNAKSEAKQTKVDNSNILDFDFDDPGQPAVSEPKQGDDNSWANFGFADANQQKPSQENDLWGAFDNNKVAEKKTNDLLSNLGDLYGQASQQQQHQQQNVMQPGFGQGFGHPGFGGQAQTNPTTSMPQSTPSDDPFAMAMHEQQKQEYERMQKAQAQKMMQQNFSNVNTNSNQQMPTNMSGMTPNMFLQMMQMMQNSGQGNPNQNAMMMAAFQNMMQQMSLNSQNAPTQEAEPEAPPMPQPQQDKSNGAFKSLFNNAASSSLGGSATRHSDLGSQSHTQSSSPFNQFGAPASQPSNTRTSEPANPFGNFGSSSGGMGGGAPAQAPNIFDTQFSNSGFSGGQSSNNQSQPSNQPASTNPFDMFK